MAKSDYPSNFASLVSPVVDISDKTCDTSPRIPPKFVLIVKTPDANPFGEVKNQKSKVKSLFL